MNRYFYPKKIGLKQALIILSLETFINTLIPCMATGLYIITRYNFYLVFIILPIVFNLAHDLNENNYKVKIR